MSGADPGYQVRGGAHLKKLRRAEGGANIFGVFRVKNHDFTPKNLNFSNFRGGARRVRPAGSTPAKALKKIPVYLLTRSEILGSVGRKKIIYFLNMFY